MDQRDPSSPRPSAKIRALSALLLAAIALGLVGAVYSMIFYVGPYRWLAELQLRWFDRYYASTTVAFTLLLCVVPPSVALRLLVVNSALPAGSFAAMAAGVGRGPFRGRFSRARRWVIVFGVGATLVVLSTRDLVVAARGKQLLQVSAHQLERGAEPAGTWLEIQGNPLWDSAVLTEEDHKSLRYVPVVSDDWRPGAKIGALLRITEGVLGAPLDPQRLSGTVDVTGVPGLVQSAYADQELDVADAVLIDAGESPEHKAGTARFLISLGAVLMLLGGVVSFVRLR